MFLIAHRGYSGNYPENTLLSFRKALEAQAKYIEFDVQYSKDKKIIIIHDFTLDRTTNSTGLVKNFTLQELKKISAGYPQRFGTKYLNEVIPTLEEAISLCKDKANLLIEIKRENKNAIYEDRLEDQLLQIVSNFSYLDKVIFLSFNLNSLVRIKKINDKAMTGSLFYSLDDKAIKKSVDIGCEYIIFNYKTLHSIGIIEKAKRSNIKIGIYTVDDIVLMRKFVNLGIDAIATNYILEMTQGIK